MSRSPSNQSPLGRGEPSSSRAPNGKQPAVEDDYSDEEALLADDPLERDLPEQYNLPLHQEHSNEAYKRAEYRSSANPLPNRPPTSHASSPHLRPSTPAPAHLPYPARTPAYSTSVAATASPAQTTPQTSSYTTSTHLATQAPTSPTRKMRRV